MSSKTVKDAIAEVADIMATKDFADKEVFIIIPNIQLADASTTDAARYKIICESAMNNRLTLLYV